MPFTDTVSIMSGRNSRASNVSAATGASRSMRSPPPGGAPPDTLASAGVLSMLKTSTDTGDIGALSFNSSRLPAMPRSIHQRRGHVSKPSVSAALSSKHSYAPSQTSKISSQWDTSSMQRRGSLTSMQSMPHSLPPVPRGKPPSQMPSHDVENVHGGRSFSMTSAAQNNPLPRHRSATSLQSQGQESRGGPRIPLESITPLPENRPPLVYPTRLKRPGYRSPSPALSDTYPQGVPAMPTMPRMMAVPHPPQVYSGYNRDFTDEYAPDPRYLNVRPPLRTMRSSPPVVDGFDPAQYGYSPGYGPMLPPFAKLPGSHAQPSMHHPSAQVPMQRSLYQGSQYASRQPYGPYVPSQHLGYRAHRGPPPPPPPSISPQVAAPAHSKFHNAARAARYLPQRIDTPLTDMSPPSSNPASSGSAPTSSNPPTPQDASTLQVSVDPAFIDPALVDLQDSPGEPVLPAKYFAFAEGLEKPIDDSDVQIPHPSVPPSGFVQRVKAMLESRAMPEASARLLMAGDEQQEYSDRAEGGQFLEDMPNQAGLYELAASETPRFTVIEEFEAPVELPASPVKIPELDAGPVPQQTGQPVQRITREMVKAELGPSSVDNTVDMNGMNGDHCAIVDVKQNDSPKSQGLAAMSVELAIADSQDQGISHQPATNSGTHNERPSEVTFDCSLPTGADLAWRFSIPADTTVDTIETHSEDPFALDVDTITAKYPNAAGADQNLIVSVTPAIGLTPPRRNDSAPVSPLRPGDEDNSRCSEVSPIQTRTLGIDETVKHPHSTQQNGFDPAGDHSMPGSFPEDSLPPPTPRTPKTYSKSVQLRPTAPSTDTGSNRFSLPGDLSTMMETTVSSGSDIITDVAVRFSLPQATLTSARPHIIDCSEVCTPDKPTQELTASKQTTKATESTIHKRNSVTFADEVAPLNINKKQDPGQFKLAINEGSSSNTKSIIRKPITREDITETNRVSRDSTTELRFLSANHAPGMQNGFGSTQLPGLKEESVEDMNVSDYAPFSSSARFPLPARIAAVKAMQERHLQESADKARARRSARRHNREIAEVRDLPSLNFSRMDLIDKLNEALSSRTSRSMDVIRCRNLSDIYSPSPQRPQSTEPLRERYMSFFNKPEDFGSCDDSLSDEGISEVKPAEEVALVPVVHIQENTQMEDEEPGIRPLSPEDFLNVATQVNRLSIPSVSGLSERISELIPGLRNLQNLQLDQLLQSDHGMAQSGVFPRPDTAISSRTSAGFRTLAERAEEFLQNSIHDSVVPGLTYLALNKELPPLPESASADRVSAPPGGDKKQPYLRGSVSAPTELGKDLVRSQSALSRRKGPKTEEEVQVLLPREMNPITRRAQRAFLLAHPNTSRPWNVDENYPWAEDKVDIDLTVPSQAHTRASISDIVCGRGLKSLDLTGPGHQVDKTNGVNVGSLADSHLDATASITSVQLTNITTHPLRKQSKRSIIESIGKKLGLSSYGEENATDRSLTKSPTVHAARASHNSHRPGDRYPTSSLTPPTAFNVDEVRSFFSDNSSEHAERNSAGALRKRLTNLKGRASRTARHSLDGAHVDTVYTGRDGGDVIGRGGVQSAMNIREGVGMGRTEFHFKRFGEKLRQLWMKSGELIRTFSTRTTSSARVRKRPHRLDEDWLADSLYSGV